MICQPLAVATVGFIVSESTKCNKPASSSSLVVRNVCIDCEHCNMVNFDRLMEMVIILLILY